MRSIIITFTCACRAVQSKSLESSLFLSLYVSPTSSVGGDRLLLEDKRAGCEDEGQTLVFVFLLKMFVCDRNERICFGLNRLQLFAPWSRWPLKYLERDGECANV